VQPTVTISYKISIQYLPLESWNCTQKELQDLTWPQAWTPASVLLAPTNWRSFLWSFVALIKAFSTAHCTVGGDSWYCQPENTVTSQNKGEKERIQLFKLFFYSLNAGKLHLSIWIKSQSRDLVFFLWYTMTSSWKLHSIV